MDSLFSTDGQFCESFIKLWEIDSKKGGFVVAP